MAPNHCGHHGRHPDKIAGGDRVPRIAEAINAAAFEHQQAVLHDVHFDHAERGSRLIHHGVHCEIEMHRVGKQAFHLQARIIIEWLRGNCVFAGNDCAW